MTFTPNGKFCYCTLATDVPEITVGPPVIGIGPLADALRRGFRKLIEVEILKWCMDEEELEEWLEDVLTDEILGNPLCVN